MLNLLGVGQSSAREADAKEEAVSPRAGQAPQEGAARAEGPEAADSLSAAEEEIVRQVDAEGRRARGGGWRRLHPSTERRAEYAPFYEASRARLHMLPFGGGVGDA